MLDVEPGYATELMVLSDELWDRVDDQETSKYFGVDLRPHLPTPDLCGVEVVRGAPHSWQ